MHWKLLATPPRGIAVLIFTVSMAMFSQSAVRISAPALGWLLSPDGMEIIGITGVVESPRDGQTYRLPAAATRIWVSPDASTLVAQSAEGLWFISPGTVGRQLASIEGPVSAAWDRTGNGFVVCQTDRCAEYSASGSVQGGFETPGTASVFAYSAAAGTAYKIGDSAVWHRNSGDSGLGEIAAGSFRPGAQELWTISPDGRLTGRDSNGAAIGSAELVADALGLVISADGNTLISANASTGASLDIRSAEINRFAVEPGIDGLWLAPGNLAVRLHESAKRPIAFWNGETGVLGWMPAAVAGEQNK